MAAKRRKQPRLLPGRRRAGHPARTWGLFRRAFAFPPWLRSNKREISRRAEPARGTHQEFGGSENDKGITQWGCETGWRPSGWPALIKGQLGDELKEFSVLNTVVY